MRKMTDWIGRVLWLYLYVNPFLDIISGTYIYFRFSGELDVYDLVIGVTPSLVVRMIMLAVFAVYILLTKDRKSILIALSLGVVWGLSIVAEYLNFRAVDLMTDVQYFAKFCYNVAILLAYERLFCNSGLTRDQLFEKLNRMLCIVSFILAAGIIIPYILDFGFCTYADRFGYRGFRGVYYSGNDITATIMLGMPITMCKYLSLGKASLKTKVFYGAAPTLSMLCLIIIGTKTAFAAILIAIVAILVYGIIRKRADKTDKSLAMLGLMLLGVIASALLLSLVAWRSVLTTVIASFLGFGDAADEGTKTLILSGRQVRLASNFKDYMAGGPVTWLFGLGRGSRDITIEMDLFEALFYYGVVGAVVMLWYYFKTGIRFVGDFFKRFELPAFGAFISLGTCAAYLTIAGHVLFSVTSGFFFAFILLYGKLLYRYDEALPAGEKTA